MTTTSSRVIRYAVAALICGLSPAACTGGGSSEKTSSPKAKVGQFVVIAGGGYNIKPEQTGRPTEAQFNSPNMLAVSPDGTIYIGEPFRPAIYRLPPGGPISIAVDKNTMFQEPGKSQVAPLVQPVDIATDARGNLFIADEERQAIREVTVDGKRLTIAGTDDKSVDIAHGKNDVREGDGRPATEVRLGDPISIAVTPDHKKIYVAVKVEEDRSIVREVDSSGAIRTIAGKVGGSSTKPIRQATKSTDVPIRLSTSLAIGADGHLLILGQQLLRLNGTELEPLPGTAPLEALSKKLNNPASYIISAGTYGYIVRMNTSLYRMTKDGHISPIATLPPCYGMPKSGDYGDIALHNSAIYMTNAECRTVVRLRIS
ncbi:hypothetical protein [Actinoallomurus oryzae]